MIFGGHLGHHLGKQCCISAFATAIFKNYIPGRLFWYIETFVYRHRTVCARYSYQCAALYSPYIVNLIKTMILDNYYRSWYANINNTSKLETYCLPQHTFGFEEYLDFIKDKINTNITHTISCFFSWLKYRSREVY